MISLLKSWSTHLKMIAFCVGFSTACRVAHQNGESETLGSSSSEGQKQDSTLVLVSLGGFTSCGLDSNQKAGYSPLSTNSTEASLLKQTDRIKYWIENRTKNKVKLEIRTCYSVDPSTIHVATNNTGNWLIEAMPLENFWTFVESKLAETSRPKLLVFGHSYGGWTAMKLVQSLNVRYKVAYLGTLDPISHSLCNMSSFAKSIQSKATTSDCQKSPGDFSSVEIDNIVKKSSGNWENFYQTNSAYLHSSEIKDTTSKIKNQNINYPSDKGTFVGHVKFLFDQELIDRLAGSMIQSISGAK